jgi:predicted ribosome quality control (RQC) complex YloA/Tae2 family protein
LKSEMTSFDIAAIVYELDKKIRGARIENIYQASPLTLILRLHQINQPTFQLLIEAGKRIHLTSYVLSKPVKPPSFCMALRKHIRNGKITEIQQHEFEREIAIKIDTRKGMYSLVTEFFGDGNIILVNPQGAILYALTYRKMRDRNILRGEHFKQAPPSGKNPLHLSQSEFEESKSYGHLETVRALSKLLSIGGLYVEEILLHAKIDKNIPYEDLNKQQIDAIYAHTKMLVSKTASGEFKPSIVIDEKGELIDVTPFSLEKYIDFTLKTFRTFNEAMDEFYSKTAIIEKVTDTERQFTRELAKLQRMLEEQQQALEDSRKIIEQNKEIGNIIFAHLSELKLLAKWIMKEKSQDKPWKQIVTEIEKERQVQCTPFVYFKSLDSKRRVLNVSIEDTSFSVDLTQSIQANAANYYEGAKKIERKQEGAKKALYVTQTKIQELKEHLIEKTEKIIAQAPLKKKKKAWYEKFRWFNSSDGFLVIGGRDATTNEIIIKKHTEPTDIVFHADIAGAPFVVIKTGGRTPPQQTMVEAAQLAVSYSKGWRELFTAIDVYWVHPNQLSKSPPTGNYLKKGAFMIHGKRNYLRKIPLNICVGIIIEKNQITVIGGPAEAIKKQAAVYIEIIPGKTPSSSLAKQIRKLLAKKAPIELQRQILATPLGEIQNFVLGKGAIAPHS